MKPRLTLVALGLIALAMISLGLQAQDQGVVLRLVVGRDPEPPVQTAETRPVLVLDHDPHRRRPRIAPRCAIGVKQRGLSGFAAQRQPAL